MIEILHLVFSKPRSSIYTLLSSLNLLNSSLNSVINCDRKKFECLAVLVC